jgi:hypothetical protein
MLLASIPLRMKVVWAAGAVAPYVHQVPDPSQIGVTGGAASFTTGFPPLTFSPIASGGVPPWGNDFNGILQQITGWNQWQAAGGVVPWDSAFSTAVGGYPKNAVVASATTFARMWVSQVDGNTTNPDTGGANWAKFDLLGTFTTGDAKPTYKTTADPGWVLISADPYTIGSASSGANFADATAADLYSLLWTNVSNSFAPVSGGRGVSAAADFAANKTLGIPKLLGRALCIAGAGTGLTLRSLGQTLGEETHTMTLAELVAHTHTYTRFLNFTNFAGGAATLSNNSSTSDNTGSTGSSTPFNVMQPSSFLNVMVKL